jgi:predicted TIM-barrel fold metal-dependent hydrolase
VTLDSLHGHVLDVCSFEQAPPATFADTYGERGKRFFEANAEVFGAFASAFVTPDDVPTELTPEVVWTAKGLAAPTAADLERRVEVLDVMGIRRQLVFPGALLIALPQAVGGTIVSGSSTAEQLRASREFIDAHNEWAGELTRRHGDRLLIAGALVAHDVDPDQLVKQAEQVLSLGVKALLIPSRKPPAGVGPGDPALDPFYALLAQADVPLLLRGGLTAGFRASEVWGAADTSVWGNGTSVARYTDYVTTVHHAEENFVNAMVYGGVFERHPTLRLGIFKVGAAWVGPLAERMDRGLPPFIVPNHLPMKPSEYLARNVRVSPFADAADSFEPVQEWLERYPALHDVYCYSSDFPLIEGGQWSLKRWHERIAPLGDDVVRKFFIDNASLILP